MQHKIIIVLLVILILISGTNLAFMFLGVTSQIEDFENTPTANFNEATGNPEATTQMQVSTYEDEIDGSNISFDYFNGWHIYSERNFDRATDKHIIIRLQSTPIKITSPAGGYSLFSDIMISNVEMGEAILAEIENLPSYQTFTKDTIEINGTEATRIKIVTDMKDPAVSYEFPFHEIIYVFGDDIGYRVERTYTSEADADEDAWQLLLETLRVE